MLTYDLAGADTGLISVTRSVRITAYVCLTNGCPEPRCSWHDQGADRD
ncbi:hypothetical protein [Kibdelosporangium philippinense]